jgi:protein-S-isoprenylcysteine O-methyltransferase Ste14
MQRYAYVLLFFGWSVWALPFVLAHLRGGETAKHVDRRARWGMVLQAIAYAALWQGRFWKHPVSSWRLGLAIGFLLLANVLAWSGTRSLGRQWRLDAGLNAEHQLVTAGPYRIIRHPIYASMLCLLLGIGFLITPWALFGIALALFLVGTEIRVRVEDALLASRFGETFREYAGRVSAYIPFVR